MKNYAKIGAGLIALYLLVFYQTGSTSLVVNGTKGAQGIIAAFQGRQLR